MLVLGAVVVVLQVPVQLQQKYPILSLAVLSWMEFFQPQKKITTFLAVQLWFIYFWPLPKYVTSLLVVHANYILTQFN